MLVKTIKKNNLFQLKPRIRFSEVQQIFKNNETQNNTCFQFAKIKKAKKIIQSTEQTLLNRIKVIKKQEEKLQKKKENQFKLFLKLENVKKCNDFNTFQRKKQSEIHPLQRKNTRKLSNKQNHYHSNFNSPFMTKRNATLSQKSLHEQNERIYERFKAQKLFLQKLQNAKRAKQQKLKNQIKISKRRSIQLSRKLQSAGLIRRNRDKVKESRQNFFRSRQQSILNYKHDIIEKQKTKFFNIQQNIRNLERQEKEALQSWKKKMQEDNFLLFEDLQINETNRWNN